MQLLRSNEDLEVPECSNFYKSSGNSLKFCNASSTTQCMKHNVNVGTKSTFHHGKNSEYTLICPVHLPLP